MELTVELSHMCGMSCKFCSSNYYDRCRELNKTERLLEISDIDALISRFNPDVIRWSGGEPISFNTNFEDIVPYVNDEYPDIYQMVNSNGKFIYDNCVERGIFDVLDEIRVTLLGEKADYIKYASMDGYERRKSNILNLIRDYKDKFSITSPLIDSDQVRHVLNYMDYWNVPFRVAGLVVTPDFHSRDICYRPIEYMESIIDDRYMGNKPDNLILSCTTSSDIPCRLENKRLVIPDNTIVRCASEKVFDGIDEDNPCPIKRNYEDRNTDPTTLCDFNER